MFLVVRFSNCNATRRDEVQIPAKQVTGNGKKLLDFVPDWFILLSPSPAKRLTFLQLTLNLQRTEIAKITKALRVDTGYHFLNDGRLFYVMGNTVLNPPEGVNLEITSHFHLLNTNGTPGQGVSWVRRFCEQGSPQAAQFVATLTAFIDPLLEATKNRGRFAVYVVGDYQRPIDRGWTQDQGLCCYNGSSEANIKGLAADG